ncbi:TetR/AcrR family transcriptional regulator [Zavarzinella formosa]|uniref:TetR/AcrR family transcriptional regulator n=1 Tax=Zavarzinella formosa TaxID=360055 RepID=UPI0002F9E81A|nr:TetR family transcriptional regulator [Zavarzinella formosa]
MRNAEATRERILEAATAEFSAYGIAGARVDRIAKNAGCNKNLIYIYFENKETLFTTVLQKHLARAFEEVQFTADDLPGYAGRLFDFAMANPDLFRLMTWFGLEQKANEPTARGAAKNAKLAALLKAQNAGQVGKTFSPGFILTAIMAIATAWTPANPYGPLIDPDALKRQAALRRSIAEAVRLLTEPKADAD